MHQNHVWHPAPRPLTLDSWATLDCPECGSGNVHLTQVITAAPERVTSTGDDGQPAPIGGVPFARSDSGTAFILVGWCEEGHELSISLVHHEGNTFVSLFTRDAPAFLDGIGRTR